MARKASMWAKSAGEYYRKNKGKNGIESFSDVLKSPNFKREYYAKYGKQGKTIGRKGKGMRTTKRYRRVGGDGDDEAPAPETETKTEAETVETVEAGEEGNKEDENKEEHENKPPMGGKRKGKGKSSKKRRAKKYSYKLFM